MALREPVDLRKQLRKVCRIVVHGLQSHMIYTIAHIQPYVACEAEVGTPSRLM